MTTRKHEQGVGTATNNSPVRINSNHSGAPLQRASEAHSSPESGMGGGQSVRPTHPRGTEKSVQEVQPSTILLVFANLPSCPVDSQALHILH
ncbi:hypothetical protein RRG08_025805 [Elysia crispata]|uniref:Uncharacterized protein n=1 Tax=Elysia crispata TaxID=231223 RepID=A0AAE1CRU9_9GAST|nr:hypothetical protein RRG08_025805 [Elysia crispata]